MVVVQTNLVIQTKVLGTKEKPFWGGTRGMEPAQTRALSPVHVYPWPWPSIRPSGAHHSPKVIPQIKYQVLEQEVQNIKAAMY